MESLAGKVVIITGASSGIGRATAEYLAKLGSRLVLVGRNEANLTETKDNCIQHGLTSDQVICVVADVTDAEKRKDVIDKTISSFGRLDVLVNNAGMMTASDQSIHTLTEEDFMTEVKINVNAPLFLTKLAIPHLKETKGCIVNVSSDFSKTVSNKAMGYRMTKAALDMMTKVFAQELVTDGIRVNSINPGYVRTNFGKTNFNKTAEEQDKFEEEYIKKTQPLGVGQSGDIAKMIAMLASDVSSHMTGECVFATGNVSPS